MLTSSPIVHLHSLAGLRCTLTVSYGVEEDEGKRLLNVLIAFNHA